MKLDDAIVLKANKTNNGKVLIEKLMTGVPVCYLCNGICPDCEIERFCKQAEYGCEECDYYSYMNQCCGKWLL